MMAPVMWVCPFMGGPPAVQNVLGPTIWERICYHCLWISAPQWCPSRSATGPRGPARRCQRECPCKGCWKYRPGDRMRPLQELETLRHNMLSECESKYLAEVMAGRTYQHTKAINCIVSRFFALSKLSGWFPSKSGCWDPVGWSLAG